MINFEFEKLDKNLDWKGIFEQLDNNFEKVAEYLASIGNRVQIESFVASANQVNFDLSTQYNTKRNCLAVYKNGVRQWLGDSFVEINSHSFQMTVPCEEGDEIVAVYNNYYLLGDINPMDYVLLKSPDESIYKLTVDNNGNLSTTKVE